MTASPYLRNIYRTPYHAYGSIFIYMFKQAAHISYKFQGICKFVALTNKLIIKNMHLSITVSFKLNARERNKMHHRNMMLLMNISWQQNQSDNLHIWHDQPIYYIHGWTVLNFYLFLFCKILIEETVLIFHCHFILLQTKQVIWIKHSGCRIIVWIHCTWPPGQSILRKANCHISRWGGI